MRLFVLLAALYAVRATAQPADSVYAFAAQPAQLLPSQAVAYAQISAAFAYPAEAARDSVRGTVLLQLIVDTEGVPTETRVLRSVGHGCDEAAQAAISGVRFTPAHHEGQVVASFVTLPVPCRPPQRTVLPIAPPAASPAAEPPPEPLTFETCTDEKVPFELIGGLARMQQRIVYPAEAKQRGVQGRVLVRFVVGTDGVPRDFEVDRTLGYGLEESAVRAVIPARFRPATCAGVPVEAQATLPITFRKH